MTERLLSSKCDRDSLLREDIAWVQSVEVLKAAVEDGKLYDAETKTLLLQRFILLTYADLKNHEYVYWYLCFRQRMSIYDSAVGSAFLLLFPPVHLLQKFQSLYQHSTTEAREFVLCIGHHC